MNELEKVKQEVMTSEMRAYNFDEINRKLEELKQGVVNSRALLSAEAIKINSPQEYQQAGDIIRLLKVEAKNLEGKRKELTTPLDIVKKGLMDWFKPLSAKYEAVTKQLTQTAIAYANEQERIKREAIAKAEAERQKEVERLRKLQENAKREETKEKYEDKILEAELAPAPIIEQPKVEGVSYRVAIKIEITDPSKVPAHFLIPDEKAIKAFVVATKGNQEVAGVKIIKEKVLVSR